MAATDELFVLHLEERVGRGEELWVEDDLCVCVCVCVCVYIDIRIIVR